VSAENALLLERVRISEALLAALREAHALAQAGEFGEPLREVLQYASDLVALANETLAADPHAGEHACGIAMHMAEQLAAVEAMFIRPGP
jgi:hypothetical protein